MGDIADIREHCARAYRAGSAIRRKILIEHGITGEQLRDISIADARDLLMVEMETLQARFEHARGKAETAVDEWLTEQSDG